MPESLLIAALSGRALAAAAKRAGYRPLVADLFNDLDTRRIAARSAIPRGDLATGIEAESLLEALEGLAVGTKPSGFVFGAGFEDRPGLIDQVANRWPLLGNGPAQISRLKDPRRFFPLLQDLRIDHPPISFAAPPAGETWLIKTSGTSGGGHVRRARAGDAPREDRYFQKRLRGREISILFLANGKEARVLGAHEQWSSPKRGAPFRFGGLAGPASLSAEDAAQIESNLSAVSDAIGLLGLNSADFILNRDGFLLLEINPRPGASLDVHDDTSQPLLAWHCRACRGELPEVKPRSHRARASAVVYAPKRLRIPPGYRWPRFTADRGAPGTVVSRGAPVCTVLASAKTVDQARDGVLKHSARVLRDLSLRRSPAAQDEHRERPAP